MPRPPQTLKAKALALIAQREHSRIELRRKLARHRQKLAERAQASLLEGVAPALPAKTVGEVVAKIVGQRR